MDVPALMLPTNPNNLLTTAENIQNFAQSAQNDQTNHIDANINNAAAAATQQQQNYATALALQQSLGLQNVAVFQQQHQQHLVDPQNFANLNSDRAAFLAGVQYQLAISSTAQLNQPTLQQQPSAQNNQQTQQQQAQNQNSNQVQLPISAPTPPPPRPPPRDRKNSARLIEQKLQQQNNEQQNAAIEVPVPVQTSVDNNASVGETALNQELAAPAIESSGQLQNRDQKKSSNSAKNSVRSRSKSRTGCGTAPSTTVHNSRVADFIRDQQQRISAKLAGAQPFTARTQTDNDGKEHTETLYRQPVQNAAPMRLWPTQDTAQDGGTNGVSTPPLGQSHPGRRSQRVSAEQRLKRAQVFEEFFEQRRDAPPPGPLLDRTATDHRSRSSRRRAPPPYNDIPIGGLPVFPPQQGTTATSGYFSDFPDKSGKGTQTRSKSVDLLARQALRASNNNNNNNNNNDQQQQQQRQKQQQLHLQYPPQIQRPTAGSGGNNNLQFTVSTRSKTKKRVASPFYAKPRDDQALLSSTNRSSALGGHVTSTSDDDDSSIDGSPSVNNRPNVLPRSTLTRGPFYSSMPKLAYDSQPATGANAWGYNNNMAAMQGMNAGMRPAMSWSHLPQQQQLFTTTQQSYPQLWAGNQQQMHQSYAQHHQAMAQQQMLQQQQQQQQMYRNVFPYTTVHYGQQRRMSMPSNVLDAASLDAQQAQPQQQGPTLQPNQFAFQQPTRIQQALRNAQQVSQSTRRNGHQQRRGSIDARLFDVFSDDPQPQSQSAKQHQHGGLMDNAGASGSTLAAPYHHHPPTVPVFANGQMSAYNTPSVPNGYMDGATPMLARGLQANPAMYHAAHYAATQMAAQQQATPPSATSSVPGSTAQLWHTQNAAATGILTPVTHLDAKNLLSSSGQSSISEASARRKARTRNCMIGWMLAVTAIIILALAIALFVQVSKDARELERIRDSINEDLTLAEGTGNVRALN